MSSFDHKSVCCDDDSVSDEDLEVAEDVAERLQKNGAGAKQPVADRRLQRYILVNTAAMHQRTRRMSIGVAMVSVVASSLICMLLLVLSVAYNQLVAERLHAATAMEVISLRNQIELLVNTTSSTYTAWQATASAPPVAAASTAPAPTLLPQQPYHPFWVSSSISDCVLSLLLFVIPVVIGFHVFNITSRAMFRLRRRAKKWLTTRQGKSIVAANNEDGVEDDGLWFGGVGSGFCSFLGDDDDDIVPSSNVSSSTARPSKNKRHVAAMATANDGGATTTTVPSSNTPSVVISPAPEKAN